MRRCGGDSARHHGPKYLSQYLPTLEIVWRRYAAGFLIAFALVNPVTRPGAMVSNRPLLQVIRALFLLLSTFLHWAGLHYLQLDQAIAIQFCSPFIVAALSGPLLGEWLDLRRWLAICVGFVGVLVVFRPGFGGVHPAALLTVASAFCYSGFAIMTRLVMRTESADLTLFYTQIIGAGVLTVAVPFVWTAPQSWLIIALMVAAGALGAAGQHLMNIAHRHAPAAILTPFFYVQMIWTPLLGFVVFGQLPNHWTLVGAAIVIAAGLYLLHCERTPPVAARR